MSSIFGVVSKINSAINNQKVKTLSSLSKNRGKNYSSLILGNQSRYRAYIAEDSIESLEQYLSKNEAVIIGYTGISKEYGNGSPASLVEKVYCITDSLILNKDTLCEQYSIPDKSITDSALIATITNNCLHQGLDIQIILQNTLSKVEGELSAIITIPSKGLMIAFSNCDSLHYIEENDAYFIATEKSFLSKISKQTIFPITKPTNFSIVQSDFAEKPLLLNNSKNSMRIHNFQPTSNANLSLLQYEVYNLKRCSKCILPETMPFIEFDSDGVCNYCHSYKKKNAIKPKTDLLDIVEPYRKKEGYDCVIPFSGGRDSCYALHIAVTELGLKPVTYTYDWGMVTEVGHRNISRMCSKLGVENILVAADIEKKRKNVSMNLKAWLKKPDLGMLNILTAGDKHFFQFVDQVKKANDIKLNLWGVNPLEVTHFKTGFLGIAPNFIEQGVYSRGVMKQVRYQSKRLKAMLKNPAYFNSSLWDTLIGEYYRSFTKQEDYYHVFDYWQWNEKDVDEMLKHYDWDRTVDSTCTWRIGDGVAGFYNYVYYTIAGFTEHDTFRSNQVREGQLTRDEALRLVEQENAPRYENLQWFFKVLGIDFNEAIKIVNSVPKLYNKE